MKTLYFVLALAVLIPSFVLADGGSAQNTATFDIGMPLSIDGATQPGIWGDFAPGTTYTVTADGYINPPDVNGATEVISSMLWTITGQAGATVNISLLLPPYFISPIGPNVPYSVNTMSAGWAGTAFGPGSPFNPFDPRVLSSVPLIAGEADVQVGGIVNVPLGAAGTYVGTFVLTAQYTGL